jgi:hypothetical protein
VVTGELVGWLVGWLAQPASPIIKAAKIEIVEIGFERIAITL